jgi:hypothetical protein
MAAGARLDQPITAHFPLDAATILVSCRRMPRPSPVLRIAAVVLLGAWLAGLIPPARGSAAEDEADTDEPAPVPVESHWYDSLVHNTNVGVDLLVIRPLAGITLAAGAVLFVPAAIMTAPNGWESMKEAYQRFVGEPSEYFASRPLGEF